MKLVVQRVLQAEVQVDGQSIGKINRGLLVFVGAVSYTHLTLPTT